MPWIIEWLQTIVYAYLLFNVAYLLLFAMAGRVRKEGGYEQEEKKRNIAVLIPCYREDAVIIQSVQLALLQNYPSFKIFVAAEGVSNVTAAQLADLPIQLCSVDFKGASTKAKALQALMQILPETFDIVLILDADNTMDEGCLEALNAAFAHGWQSVQLHRTAKNMNGGVAVLDGISEEINNNIFRKGQRTLGFSSCLIGSAMAMDASVFREIFSSSGIEELAGEDREVDRLLLQKGIVTEYIDRALVYDEKVSNVGSFQRQRTRWYEAQFSHIVSLVKEIGKRGHKGKDFWNRIIINQMPPRLLMLAFIIFVILLKLLLSALAEDKVEPALNRWLFLFVLLIISMLVSIPKRYLKLAVVVAALQKIPAVIFYMFRAIFNINPGRKEFLHTSKAYKDQSGL